MTMTNTRKDKGSSESPHLKDSTNFLSHFLFCWELNILYKKWKNKLTETDYSTPLKEHESKELGDRLELNWENEKHSKSPSLMKVLIKSFGQKFAAYGIIYFLVDLIVTLLQPLYLAKCLDSFMSPQTESQSNLIYYGSIVTIFSFCRALSNSIFYLEMTAISIKVRMACCSLLYRTILKFKKTSIQKISFGRVINLLTNDIERFDIAFRYMHYIWFGPVKTVVTLCFLCTVFNWRAATGIVATILVVSIQVYILTKISNSRKSSTLETERRIGLMNDIVCKIQTIKMYAWENLFEKLVKNSRRLEIKKINVTNYLRLIILSFELFLVHISVFLYILVVTFCGLTIKSYHIYVIINVYELLSLTVILCGFALSFVSDVKLTIERMQEILLAEHKSESYTTHYSQENLIGISTKNMSLKWDPSSKQNTLNCINICAAPSELIAVVGSAGSGKSTLLEALLRNIDFMGDVHVKGTVSYASQEPWIFPATVKENIVFVEEMDEKRYHQVIRLCALEHDLSLFSHGDKTILRERGLNLSGGQKARISLARAIYRNADIYLLDDPLSAIDGHVANHIFHECIMEYLRDKCVVFVTNQIQHLEDIARIYVLQNGTVAHCGKFQDVKDFVGVSIKSSTKSSIPTKNFEIENEVIDQVNDENKETVNISTYKTYLVTYNKYLVTCFLLLSILLLFLLLGINYVISLWVDQKEKFLSEDYGTKDLNFLGFYSALIVTTLCTIFLSILIFGKHCSRTTKKLHDNLFDKISMGSMLFFQDHSSGRILNRFSRDIGVIDELTPQSLYDMIKLSLIVLEASIWIVALNYWMIIPTIVMYSLFYLYTTVFVPSFNYLKLVEKTRTSPLCTHISTSLQGLSTIRALEAQCEMKTKFDKHQNLHGSVYYTSEAVYFAYSFWVDFTCAIFSAVVILSSCGFHNGVSVGHAGLVIIQSMRLIDIVQYDFRRLGEFNSQMTSVERVIEYTDLTSEEDSGTFIPKDSWPEGKIVFDLVSLRYSLDKPPILKNITLTIEHGEKIGIIGRTGAGKSSIISVLFRLFDFEGKIFIDGIDTKTVPLKVLRSNMAIIPQEPVLFKGTLRKNLDPFDKFSDVQLWKALEDVELKNLISTLHLGLESDISESGSNFSVGQRQLLCLARIILKDSKIVILDEATANVDLKTDELIQSTLRRKFSNSTVLTIAHRLDTVIDSDKILVIDSGNVVEFDNPTKLLKNPDGFFYKYFMYT